MKINEVEALVGITRKNIRFYESEGLLSPRRNSENGYRDYGEAEVEALRRIKLLRKLGVPLEEIRQMQSGAHTVGDGMRRHLVSLERERGNLDQAIRLCGRLTDRQERLCDLDAESVLAEMDTLEQTGTTFQNKQKRDVRIRYVAPVVITVGMTLLMMGLTGLLFWSIYAGTNGSPPALMLAVITLLPLVVIGGVVLALIQRIREIGKGEEDDAKSYGGEFIVDSGGTDCAGRRGAAPAHGDCLLVCSVPTAGGAGERRAGGCEKLLKRKSPRLSLPRRWCCMWLR